MNQKCYANVCTGSVCDEPRFDVSNSFGCCVDIDGGNTAIQSINNANVCTNNGSPSVVARAVTTSAGSRPNVCDPQMCGPGKRYSCVAPGMNVDGADLPGCGSVECSDCLSGRYRAESLHTETSCSLCEAGKYQSSSGQSSCQSCAAGQYQSSTGQSSCQSCAAGQYQSSTGQSSCQSCSNGQTSASGSTSSGDCYSTGSGDSGGDDDSGCDYGCTPSAPPVASSAACHAASGDDWWCASTWDDALCDEQCNNAACGYDNHDCMSESDVSICNGEDLMTPCEADSAEDATDSESLEFLRGSCSASCASAYTVFWDLCEIPYTNPASNYASAMETTSVNQFRTFYGVCQDTLNPVVLTEKSSGAAAAAALPSSAAVLLAMVMIATWMMPAV